MKTLNTATLLAAAVVALTAMPAFAAEIHISCPAAILTSQESRSKLAEWQPFIDKVNDDKHRLDGLQVYDGPPADNVSLKPERKNLPHNGSLVIWTFGSPRDRDIWMACTYQKTAIKLIRNVGRQVRSCSSTLDQFHVPQKTTCI